jgi:hypothetical protein
MVVEVAPVIQKDVPVQGEWVGTLEAYGVPEISRLYDDGKYGQA